MKLPRSFYFNPDVVHIAKELIGKCLITNFNNSITSGYITETEAYAGITDKASHAYGGRFTKRTEVMYREGGIAYIYLCYGIHSLFNIVTNIKGVPHAILIRGIEPASGKEIMSKRLGQISLGEDSGCGPGKVSKLLGIHHSQTGTDLFGDKIWLEEMNFTVDVKKLKVKPRIGVGYAGEDAYLPYRFIIQKETPT